MARPGTGLRPALPRHSLRFRVMLALLLVTLLPIGSLGVFAYVMGRQQTREAELDRLADKTREVSALVDRYLATSAQLARHLADTTELQSFLSDPRKPEAMNVWLKRQCDLDSQLNSILVIQSDGTCIASSDPRFTGQNYAFRPYYKDGMAGLSRFTDWQIGVVSQKPCVFIAGPVKRQDRILGLLVLRIDMGQVQQMVASAGAKGRDVLLVNRDGIILAHTRPSFVYRLLAPISDAKRREIEGSHQFMEQSLVLLDIDPTLAQAVQETIDRGLPIRHRYRLAGERRWATLARLDSEPWAIGVAVNEATVFAQSWRILGLTALVAGLSLVLVLGAGFIFSRQILRPLEELTETLEAFGRGESQHRSREESPGEVGRLARSFNRMADQISEQTRALEQRVDTLEGILPICASCKKIRNEKGIYEPMESYISDRSKAQFSHGLCEDCARQLYPEFYKG